MKTPLDIATARVQYGIDHGEALEQFQRWSSSCHTDTGDGKVYITIGGGKLYPEEGSTEAIKVKPYQIGVAIYRRGQRGVYGLFDARDLWELIVNPKPVQLGLFDEVL